MAVKGSTSPHLKTRYADLSSVWAACRAALAENELSVVQLPVSDDPGYVALETMLLHSSGEFISARCRVRLPKDDPQGAGSGLTYLRRYALSAAPGIVADEDDDAEAASQPLPAKSTANPPAAPARPLSAESGPAPAHPARKRCSAARRTPDSAPPTTPLRAWAEIFRR